MAGVTLKFGTCRGGSTTTYKRFIQECAGILIPCSVDTLDSEFYKIHFCFYQKLKKYNITVFEMVCDVFALGQNSVLSLQLYVVVVQCIKLLLHEVVGEFQ